MTTLAWVIGRGGLLGSAIERRLSREPGERLFTPTCRWDWNDGQSTERGIAESVAAFAEEWEPGSAWQVYWAAGQGTMGSTADAMALETAHLQHLLACMAKETRLDASAGVFFFASSAGAIDSATTDAVVTEETPPYPSTPYGRAKLLEEQLLRAWTEHRRTPVVVARLATLYGPGQTKGKKQGLITHIVHAVLRHQPVNIFVPLDTVRDYLYVEDAATRVRELVGRAAGTRGVTTAIVASERATTIAQIVGIVRQLTRLHPRIVRSTQPLAATYPRIIRFRSRLPRDRTHDTPLHVGIAQTLAFERLAMADSTRP